MFNRVVEMKIVKKARAHKQEQDQKKELDSEEKAMMAAYLVDQVGKKIVFGLAAYVVVDTLRQIAVKKFD